MSCDFYTLDLNGKTFGACKCGHPKAAHVTGQGVPHAEAWAKNLGSAPAPAADEPDASGPGAGACDNFRLDMNASGFAVCVCGVKRELHAGQAGAKPRGSDLRAKGPHPPAHPPPAAAAHPPVEEYEPGACDNFRLDPTAATFNTCVCSWPKSEHGKPRRKKGEAAHDAGVVTGALHKDKSAEPCDHYQVDVKSVGFSLCTCGWDREAHKRAGTLHEAPLREFAGGHGGATRATIVAPKKGGKADRPCNHYQVDINAKNFGDCHCQWPKLAHAEFGGHVDVPDAPAAPKAPEPEKIVRDGVHPCSKFELDLANQGGYGLCVCGFSRIDHETFHKDPEEWNKVKAGLTAPKPFT